MPTYKVTDPTTGQTLRLTGDSPPTEQELNDIFSKVNISQQPQLKTEQPKTAMQMPKEEFIKLPYWQRFQKAGVEPFMSEVVSPLAHFGSALAADIPETIIRKYFPQAMPPEQQTAIGKVTRNIGEIAGFGMGLPTKAGIGAIKLATKAIPYLARKTIIPSVIKGALGSGVAMGALTPQEGLLAFKERFKQAKIGVTIGGIAGMIAPSIIKFKKWLNPKNQLALGDEIRNSLIGQKHNIMKGFDKQYQNITKEAQGKIVSLREPFQGLLENTDDVVNTIQGQQEFNEALAKNVPSAKKLLNLIKTFRENPNIPINISVEEADTLQKFIKQMPSIQGKIQRTYKQGFEQIDWTNAERILLDFANDIKASVLDLAPELKVLNQNYGQFMTNFKQIRPYLKWNNAVTNIKNIHKLDPAILNKLQQILPQNIINNILQMNRTLRNAELLKRIGWRIGEGAALGAGGYGVYRGLRR